MNLLKRSLLIIVLVTLGSCESKKEVGTDIELAKSEITTMMMQTAVDWSKGDLEAFMKGYIKSDKLYFVGGSGLTSGWQQTLDNYKKGYPTPEHTGNLTFDLEKFEPLANDVFLVIGQYHLKRGVGDANGWFSLILKKIDGEWKIIADHSSSS